MNIFDRMLSNYQITTSEDYTNAVHEIMQQISLGGLYRSNFFDKAAFYGGTCLRIFHGLNRFSEDMDFSLLLPDSTFTLEPYFQSIKNEFKAAGREVIINRKEKKNQSSIESAFLKDDTAVYDLKFNTEKNIKIKIEVDINPPMDFNTELKLLMQPFSFMTRCYTPASLFAGKMHALLFRSWKNRVKGRDWYDFEWYVRNNIPLDFNHFCQRLYQSENLTQGDLSKEKFIELLKEKISLTNIEMVKQDVKPFLKDQSEMNIWSTDYFLQLVQMIRFE